MTNEEIYKVLAALHPLEATQLSHLPSEGFDAHLALTLDQLSKLREVDLGSNGEVQPFRGLTS
jgi:hypothetical protein